jgi:hypothetical protein
MILEICLGIIFLAAILFAGACYIHDRDRFRAWNARMAVLRTIFEAVPHCPACRGPSEATRCHVLDPFADFQTAVCLSCGHVWAILTPVNKP